MLTAENLDAPLDVQRRTRRRVAYQEPCFVQSDTRALWVQGINLSDGGMCVAISELGVLKRGVSVAIFLQNYSPIDAVVRWTRGTVAGLSFKTPSADHPEIDALLKRISEGGPAWPKIVRQSVDDKLPDSFREVLRRESVESATTESAVVKEQPSQIQLRKTKRISYAETCRIKTGKRTFQAQSLNISEGGMSLRLRGLGKVETGIDIEVVLPGGYPPIGATLRWVKDRDVGVQFHKSIKGHPVLRALEQGHPDEATEH